MALPGFFNGYWAELKKNRAGANGFAGGSDPDLVGLGIDVTNYTTVLYGMNIAVVTTNWSVRPATIC